MPQHDGDGALVKRVADGQTTVYVGKHYEVQAGAGSSTVYSQDFSTSQGWAYPEYGVQPDGGTARYAS